ncbi:putative transposable element [Trichonephila clavipes]|nr:putative transposable element [Trichonephila clavipes]
MMRATPKLTTPPRSSNYHITPTEHFERRQISRESASLQVVAFTDVGVPGNEAADELAGRGCDLPNPSSIVLTHTEIPSFQRNKMNLTRQNPPAHHWYAAKSPVLSIQCRSSRAHQTALARLRSGHLRSMTFVQGELWFQQDGATCHTARATIDLLKDTLGDRLISRFGPVNWPPRSCDLTPLDYFLWGYVKSLVYTDKPQTLDHLEDNIRRVIADIRPQMLEKVIENWTSRLDYIRASRGSPMPEIIFKM